MRKRYISKEMIKLNSIKLRSILAFTDIISTYKFSIRIFFKVSLYFFRGINVSIR